MFFEDEPTSLQCQTAEVRYVARCVNNLGFANPSLFAALWRSVVPLLKKATLLASHGLDGAFLRLWDTADAEKDDCVATGVNLYTIAGMRFAVIPTANRVFLVAEAHDRTRLQALAVPDREETGDAQRPVLSDGHMEIVWNNTIGYLEEPRLNRINQLGGRARRGVLLSGPPGNGKTMACRWLCEECRRRHWEWTVVTPDDYLHARQTRSIDSLLSVFSRGIVFFDDMDRALRDRETAQGCDDQSILLAALDGMEVKRGVVFVFTTNCGLEMIDRAFKRPGRIDVALAFRKPDCALRRRLIERWNPEIRSHLDAEQVVAATDGYSFAEIEELKNLLIMRFMDNDRWDWDSALRQFKSNRQQLRSKRRRPVGFLPAEKPTNGDALPHRAR